MLVFFGKRTVQRYNIAFGKQLFKRHVIYAVTFGRVGVVGYNIHTEATADINKTAANFTRADDPDCLSVQVKSSQSVKRKVKIPCPQVRLVYPSYKGKQKPHSVFGYGVGRVCRNAHYRYFACGIFNIHIVKSRAAQRNQFHPVTDKSVNYLTVDNVVDKSHDRVAPVGKRGGVGGQLCFKVFKFHAVIGGASVKADYIVRLCVKKCNGYHNCIHPFGKIPTKQIGYVMYPVCIIYAVSMPIKTA